MKYIVALLLFFSAFGAVNPQPIIKEVKIGDGHFIGKIANVTVGTIITVWCCENIEDVGKANAEFMAHSFYGYAEEVTFVFPSDKNHGFCWITQTPYYPAPK